VKGKQRRRYLRSIANDGSGSKSCSFIRAGAGLITGGLSPPFGKLMGEEQQLEGDYRHLHARLRTHSESIAFYGGQDREVSGDEKHRSCTGEERP
jgi:hypothetical protein